MLSFPAQSWQSSLISDNSQAVLTNGRVASLILPRLYLSDFFTARDQEKMTTLGITHMISVMERIPTTTPHIPKFHVPIADSWDADILIYLDRTTDFIRQALTENESNKVLVHCFQGVSRSATVVCAYVIAQAATSMTAAEAIDFVRAKRGIVSPNPGFRTQLASYSEQFVGNRAQRASSVVAPTTRRASKISVGIAERIRRFKTGDAGSNSAVTIPVAIEEDHNPSD